MSVPSGPSELALLGGLLLVILIAVGAIAFFANRDGDSVD
jgi:hypothetical protein